MECPRCHSTDDHRLVWHLGMVFRIALDVAVVITNLGLFVLAFAPGFEGPTYKRKCRRCGQVFRGRGKLAENLDECPRCGYLLIGNVTGRCSECGWRLPRRYRKRRALDDTRTDDSP